MDYVHKPVLLAETIAWLRCIPGGIYIDCTLGGGGHAAAILERIKPGGRLLGIDRDPAALEAARRRLAPYGAMVSFIQGNFRDLAHLIAPLGVQEVDGILFDLGVSSPQLERAERGFSYHQDGPLDMRMDPRQTITAAHLVNELPQEELARILWEYGEERWAARIAQFIVAARKRAKLKTTGELVAVIKQAVPAGARKEGPHPARRTFQALRIAVNEELDSLAPALETAVQLLKPGGRLCVISFHSLEDRIVKRTFHRLARGCTCPPEFPACVCGRQPLLEVLTRRPVIPTAEEVQENPRARSAKLRVAEKRAGVLKTEGGE
ncbi:MAG TPA: 16S rRNA (cytosine(1402)-N(4))-methyltransferase RsmH [Firmicutes bacterium]|nr:16S rRNA (cytosine(1402)-N(4))-methyltransferase RsmH [Bacillota bacterium]